MQLLKNRYYFGGVDLLEVANQFGTPLYVYDAETISRQYKKLNEAFAGVDLKIKYACKALNNINIIKYLKSLGAGLDTVSIEEVEIGLKAGYKPAEILFTPNCVDFSEIKKAVEYGVTINIDNISILEQFGHDYGSKVECCLRLNPHIMAGGNSHISVGHIDSKFGISIYQLPLIDRIVKNNKIKVFCCQNMLFKRANRILLAKKRYAWVSSASVEADFDHSEDTLLFSIFNFVPVSTSIKNVRLLTF